MAPTFVASGTSTPTLVAKTSTSSGVAFVFYTSASDPSPGLSPGATAGIGVGAAIGAILLLGGLGFLVWRWRKNRHDDDDDTFSRAGGATTPATMTARDSDFYSGRTSRTPVSYAGFDDKVVSPHASTAGSPPPVVSTYPVAAPPPAHLSEAPAPGGPPGGGYYAPVRAGSRRHPSWTSSSGYGTAVGPGPGSPVYEGGGYPIHETEGYAVHEAGGQQQQHYSHFSEELPAETGYGYETGGHGGQEQVYAVERRDRKSVV